MKNSRIAIIALILVALTGVGFSAAGSKAKPQAADDCCSSCSSCDSCCAK